MDNEKGTIAIVQKLKSIVKDSKLEVILNEYAESLSPIFYAGAVLFHSDALRCLEKGVMPIIDETHINRCMMIVQGKTDFRKRKNKETGKMRYTNEVALKHLLETYDMYKESIFNKMELNCLEQIDKPLTYAAKQLLVNIQTNIMMHYEKFQKKYLRARLQEYLHGEDVKIKKSVLAALTYYLQQSLNLGKALLKTVKNNKLSNGFYKKVRPHVQVLRDKIHCEIPETIQKPTKGTLKNKDNTGLIVQYLHKMSRYLEDHRIPTFCCLPLPKLRRRHFVFEKYFLMGIYKKWKTNENRTVNKLKDNFQTYYEEMFLTHKKYRKLCDRAPPISYSTNGYSVTIMFPNSKEKKTRRDKCIEKKEQQEQKKEVEKISKTKTVPHPKKGNLEPRLYDADTLRMSEKQFDQYFVTSIDPGNSNMLTCANRIKTGFERQETIISKGYYNDISHITKNTWKLQKMRMKNPLIRECEEELSLTSCKSSYLRRYLDYVQVQVKYWKALWEHNLDMKIQKIKYDTYLHERMAVGKVCRQILNLNHSGDPHLIIFGKGNGNTTISNTRNTSSHGPIKRIAHALSRLVPVVLTDENLTSQLCHRCFAKVSHPKMDHTQSIKNALESIGIKDLGRKAYKAMRRYVSLCKLERKLQVVTQRKVYKACYCTCSAQRKIPAFPGNKKGNVRKQKPNRRGVIWRRDPNSARCICLVARGKLLGKPLKEFSRSKQER
jgi:hypothetical protein